LWFVSSDGRGLLRYAACWTWDGCKYPRSKFSQTCHKVYMIETQFDLVISEEGSSPRTGQLLVKQNHVSYRWRQPVFHKQNLGACSKWTIEWSPLKLRWRESGDVSPAIKRIIHAFRGEQSQCGIGHCYINELTRLLSTRELWWRVCWCREKKSAAVLTTDVHNFIRNLSLTLSFNLVIQGRFSGICTKLFFFIRAVGLR